MTALKQTTKGAIAAGHIATAEAGAETLRLGGNAFDAVVAAGFASFVAELSLTSAAGGGFLTGYFRETKECILLDFFVNMPGLGTAPAITEKSFFPVEVDFGTTHQEFHIGSASVAVPGSLAGLFETHRHFGILPIDTVLAPAIRLAREGLPVNHHQEFFFTILRPILTLTEEGRSIFTPGGSLLKEGERLYLGDFANTLERFANEGPSLLYSGALADQMLQRLSRADGLVTRKDLASYRVEKRRPLSFEYRGYTILTNPPPSAGGPLIALCLQILEGIPLTRKSFQTEEALNALVAAMQVTNAVREAEYDGRIHEDGLTKDLFAGSRIRDYRKLHREILSGKKPPPNPDSAAAGSSSTTHISVIDAEGNAASLTASNGEGSGILIPGTGIMLNNMLGEEDLNPSGFHRHEPGRRISSMMSPTIVLHGKEPVAVLGSGGSNRIRSAITQSIMNLIDFKKDVRQVVNAPRVHWERGTLNQEPGFGASVARHLCGEQKRILWKETNLYFGGVHAVTRDQSTGDFAGAGDHRRGGVAIVVA